MSESEWKQAEQRLRWAVDLCMTELGPANWHAVARLVELQDGRPASELNTGEERAIVLLELRRRFNEGERTEELLRAILALE